MPRNLGCHWWQPWATSVFFDPLSSFILSQLSFLLEEREGNFAKPAA
jgi:hypothetical protein